MTSLSPARMPVAARAGIPLAAAALLAAACGSGSGTGSGPQAGASPGGTSKASTVITTKTVANGTFLTDVSGRTVYLWTKDSADKSVCSGTCAGAWPPVPATSTVTASGGAKAADLGMITRSDGTRQVTYDGHPLYYFAGDSGPGQVHGQGNNGFGAKWWVVAPSGTPFTGAVPGSGASPSAGSGSYGGGGY